MDLLLSRKSYRSDGIFGELTGNGGSFFCVTLEHSYPEPAHEDGSSSGKFLTKIKAGKYSCKRYHSPKHGYDVFLLTGDLDGDGFTADGRFFEIHIGNYNDESEGCILVGEQVGSRYPSGKMICGSRKAFEKLMAAQEGIDFFTLTVEDLV